MRAQTIWGSAMVIMSMASSVSAIGYYIDPVSCTADMRDLIKRALDGSFQMAQAGLDNEAEAQGDNQQTQLITNLFGTNPQQRLFIRSRLTGLLTLNNQYQTNEDLNPGVRNNNVKIYCNENRLKVRTQNPLTYFDTDVQEVIKGPLLCLQAVAWTVQTQNSHGQIQICPWFMQKVLGEDYKITAELKKSFLTKLATSALTFLANRKYEKIDLAMLLDKVLLHELTHLNAGGRTVDVGGFSGYGWTNVRRLSTVVSNTQGPRNNADTWALYGSASLLIRSGYNVDANGAFTPRTATKRALQAVKAMRGLWKTFVA